MKEALLISLETTLVGVMLLAIGYLLRVHTCTFLIAGFEDDRPISKEVVAKKTGTFLLVIGAITIGFGYVATEFASGYGMFGPTYGGIVLLGTLHLTYRIHATTTETGREDISIWPAD